MARSKRMSVQKRLREKKKAEAAALKRMERIERARREPVEAPPTGGTVAAREDLEGYGVIAGPSDESRDS